MPQKQPQLIATRNEQEHNDYQHPQAIWHSCTGGKEP
jgi:hypothetical protein